MFFLKGPYYTYIIFEVLEVLKNKENLLSYHFCFSSGVGPFPLHWKLLVQILVGRANSLQV